MQIVSITTVLFLLLFGQHGEAVLLSTCNHTMSLRCPDEQKIFIVEAKPSIASRLLEQCNTQQECHVKNPNLECNDVTYWCKTKMEICEVEHISSLTIKRESLIPDLVSKDYYKGSYQMAQDINCNITLSNSSNNSPKRLEIRIYELAPFINSKEYCLTVRDSGLLPFCSGSGKFYRKYGPITDSNYWQFSLALSPEATSVPWVRFWIFLKVSSVGAYGINLHCTSNPAMAGGNQATWLNWRVFVPAYAFPHLKKISLIAITATFCDLCALLAAAVVYVTRNKRSTSAMQHEEDQPQSNAESVYSEARENVWKVDDFRCPPPTPLELLGSLDDTNPKMSTSSLDDGYVMPYYFNSKEQLDINTLSR